MLEHRICAPATGAILPTTEMSRTPPRAGGAVRVRESPVREFPLSGGSLCAGLRAHRRAAPEDLLGPALTELYEPLGCTWLTRAAFREWMGILNEAHRTDPGAMRDLLCELQSGLLYEHRAQLAKSALGALKSADALVGALWAEALLRRGEDLRDYRILRDDFDLLKGRYLDIFELAFHSLALTARVANIARRGDAAWHADGYRASLHQTLEHTRAHQRERWLVDFPTASRLYGRLKRARRNDISHGRLRHDIDRGELIHRDGRSESYLHFLIDCLQATRLTQYLIGVLVGFSENAHRCGAPQ